MNFALDYFTGATRYVTWTGAALLVGPQVMQHFFKGFYVWPRFGIGMVFAKQGTPDGVAETTASFWTAAVSLGYQWRWRWFALRLGGGLSHVGAISTTTATEVSIADRTALLMDLAFGVAF
jgi:hypothetical protein